MNLDIAMYWFDPNIAFFNPTDVYEDLTILDEHDKPTLEQLETAYAAYEAAEVIRLAAEARKIWLATQRELARKALDNKAERENLKYITPGAGTAMRYQRQQDELERWLRGDREPCRLMIAEAIARRMEMTVQQVMNEWYTNINAWLQLGSVMAANLYKAKHDLLTVEFTTEQEFEDFVNSFNIYQEIP